MLKPRVIKSEGCFKCKNYLKYLSKVKYDIIIYDADLEENQDELDKWKINMMPVVQIVNVTDEGEEKVFQFPPGRFAPHDIDAKIEQLNKGGNYDN